MRIIPLTVLPKLPEPLTPLKDLAGNLWFAWNPEAVRLFQGIDPALWDVVDHNPVRMLAMVDQEHLDELAKDEGFLNQLALVHKSYNRYISDKRNYSYRLETPAEYNVAYFSAEYGLADCLQVYSGGLGVLSGDHLKSASDIHIPLIAVGLFYREGYFQQHLDSEGWQQEHYPDINFHEVPCEQARERGSKGKGAFAHVEVTLEGRRVVLNIWKVKVGRVRLFLLDSDHPDNSPEDRKITGQLYGGDREMRLKQEIILGIGGVRALAKLEFVPAAFHMNEGHSAFAALERLRMLLAEGLSRQEAMEFIRVSNVFTTHTPVPAGNDMFAPDLLTRFFRDYVKEAGLSMEELLALGRLNPQDHNEPFCMTVLALKLSAWANGVSELHAKVSRKMWESLWPGQPGSDIPIAPLTNGVHIPSWISYEMLHLYDRYLGPRWNEDPDNEKVWERVKAIPDTELWRTHERRRERLVAFVRREGAQHLVRRGAPRAEIEAVKGILNPEALTIGFARRFATYKRAVLIFRDADRLAKILNDEDKPVQIIVAGKAHPADKEGKAFIQEIVKHSREPRFRNKIFFLENYDMNVARYLVQGVDVWLNNPRRPLEACGTSGMKAAANGALNLSILDGWWDEAYNGENGWAIGGRDEFTDMTYQDELESRAIYDLLEKEVVPLFYTRGLDNLPKAWIDRMRHSLATIGPRFNSHRMVEDYMEKFYHPASQIKLSLEKDKFRLLKDLSAWRAKVEAAWPNLKIQEVTVAPKDQVDVYQGVKVKASIDLGGLSPDEVAVEAHSGRLDQHGEFIDRSNVEIRSSGVKDGSTLYEGEVVCGATGRIGVSLRILPKHAELVNPAHLNLVKWVE